ncbi:unnamed protein product [Mytilus edulis]|uniref:UspA domain-containing protein n=2 Tax=Mytilus TaxID=6548 RepID=A0A8B6BHD0_MYTGA|nr:unnamed protein product [Mytilus edulis]VDH90766.1 Hypothetical predicted protein [Mytilus galloprovincialis]
MAESSRKRVVLAMDGSKESDNALDFYMKNIHKDTDEVILVHCVEHGPHSMGSIWMPLDPQVIARAIQDEEKKGTEICTKLKTLLPMYKSGGSITVTTVVGGEPGPTIIQKAEECGASVIVVGSRGLGTVRRTILGSVSDYILHHADVPVLVCH